MNQSQHEDQGPTVSIPPVAIQCTLRWDTAEEPTKQKKKAFFAFPLVIAIFSAVFGLLGTGLGVSLQGYWNTQLERQKFELALIQKALEPKDEQERVKNLQFLVDAGLLKTIHVPKLSDLAKMPELLTVVGIKNYGDRGGCQTRCGIAICGENEVAICKENKDDCSISCVSQGEAKLK